LESLLEDQSLFQEPGKPPSPLAHVGRLLLRALSELVQTLLPAVVIALVINLFLAQATVVEGMSMEPNLHNAERVIVEKVTYHFVHGPARGDVVVLHVSGQEELLIKRVVALPGETVEVRGGQLYINGRLVDEPWTDRQGGPDYPPTVVPPMHVFVMGDNRGQSNDSRSFGPIPVDQIVGRACFVYWPPDQFGPVH